MQFSAELTSEVGSLIDIRACAREWGKGAAGEWDLSFSLLGQYVVSSPKMYHTTALEGYCNWDSLIVFVIKHIQPFSLLFYSQVRAVSN